MHAHRFPSNNISHRLYTIKFPCTSYNCFYENHILVIGSWKFLQILLPRYPEKHIHSHKKYNLAHTDTRQISSTSTLYIIIHIPNWQSVVFFGPNTLYLPKLWLCTQLPQCQANGLPQHNALLPTGKARASQHWNCILYHMYMYYYLTKLKYNISAIKQISIFSNRHGSSNLRISGANYLQASWTSNSWKMFKY